MSAAARHRRDGTTSDGAEPPPKLAAAIRAALGYLADLTGPPSAVVDGRLDHMLRAAVAAHTAPGNGGAPAEDGTGHRHHRAMDEVAVAVRTACAHLAADGLEDAYLVLRTAADGVPQATT